MDAAEWEGGRKRRAEGDARYPSQESKRGTADPGVDVAGRRTSPLSLGLRTVRYGTDVTRYGCHTVRAVPCGAVF
jgi:hypothetical protein